jgi:HD superfamily phosphohydrolase YqeK
VSSGSAPAIHPLLAGAAEGELPSWTEAGVARRAHIRRVMALLAEWAEARGLQEGERIRWMAAGALHDALRDADPEVLRRQVPPRFRGLPGPLLHGPAAANRLEEEGVEDDALLRAVAYHSLGHPGLDAAGRALFASDFLEPARRLNAAWRQELVRRYPSAPRHVLVEVVRARMVRQLERGWPLRPETLDFWNSLVEE